ELGEARRTSDQLANALIFFRSEPVGSDQRRRDLESTGWAHLARSLDRVAGAFPRPRFPLHRLGSRRRRRSYHTPSMALPGAPAQCFATPVPQARGSAASGRLLEVV